MLWQGSHRAPHVTDSRFHPHSEGPVLTGMASYRRSRQLPRPHPHIPSLALAGDAGRTRGIPSSYIDSRSRVCLSLLPCRKPTHSRGSNQTMPADGGLSPQACLKQKTCCSGGRSNCVAEGQAHDVIEAYVATRLSKGCRSPTSLYKEGGQRKRHGEPVSKVMKQDFGTGRLRGERERRKQKWRTNTKLI